MAVISVLARDFGVMTSRETGEIIKWGKIQVLDSTVRVETSNLAGTPAYWMKCDPSLSSVFSADKVPAKFELQISRIPKRDRSGKDIIEEKVVAAKQVS